MKRAIVLGGGGARGSYQIGVWRALRELKIDYSIVVGTSVGALNGALMVQGEYARARALWENLTVSDVVAHPNGEELHEEMPLHELIRIVGQGGLDTAPLEQKVRDILDEECIRRSPMNYGLVTVRYPKLKPIKLLKEEIPNGQLTDYMLASAAWYPFFQPKAIGQSAYIDGGYTDNLPAELALRCGAEEILAVDLFGTGIVHKFKEDIPVRHIRSHWSLGDMMDFSPQHSRQLMRLGYLDGLRAYRRVEGQAYAFFPGESRRNVVRLRWAMDTIHQRTGISLLRRRQSLPGLQRTLAYHGSDHRFVKPDEGYCTLSHALTTAAEIAGELLGLPHDRIYRMQGFNRLLLERAMRLASGETFPEENVSLAQRRSRALMLHLLHELRSGVERGELAERFRGVVSVSQTEFVGAYYLLAAEMCHCQAFR